MINRIKKNKYWVFIFILLIILKTTFVAFGLPYAFHPDEIYILKDPFKIANNYINGNFDFPFSLVYYIQLLWYGILFCLGFAANLWTNFNEFTLLIIGENEIILIWGRLLSVLLSLFAGIVGIKLIKRITRNRVLQYIFGISFLLNPFEIVSNIWIKYDSFVYLFFMIISYYSYLFVFEDNYKCKKWAYLTIFLGLAIRVDLIITIIPLVLWEMKGVNFRSIVFYFRTNFKILSVGIIIYLLITLWPIVLTYLVINPSVSNSIQIVEPFWQAILRKIVIENHNFPTLLNNIINNFTFYLFDCFILGLGPVLFLILIVSFIRNRKEKYLLFQFVLYLGVLVLFPHAAMHYFLITSLLILIISFIFLSRFNGKYILLIASLNLLYVVSFLFSFVWLIYTSTDTRIIAKDYILSITDENDLIGLEDFINPGLFPPIDEHEEILIKKSNVVKELRVGTGLTLLEKSKDVNFIESRNILSISNKNPWEDIGVKNRWNCIYSDTNCIIESNADFIVSRKNHIFSSDTVYSKFIVNNYQLIKNFNPIIFDVRINKIVKTEPFFMSFYIYKKR